ncbi:MAG: hypothetical protein ACTSRS_05535 [Candidatus Helarchaeota archaeon]
MPDLHFSLDDLPTPLQSWLKLIDQARRAPMGLVAPTFLEIIDHIVSFLKDSIPQSFDLPSFKCLFIGFALIQYLTDRYAIEKVMLFAKGRCHTSNKTPSELIAPLLLELKIHLENSQIPSTTSALSRSMYFLLRRNFHTAQVCLLPVKSHLLLKLNQQNLSLLETLLLSLLKSVLIPSLKKSLNLYSIRFRNTPLFIYFTVLNYLLANIEDFHASRRATIRTLLTFFDNLSHLVKC